MTLTVPDNDNNVETAISSNATANNAVTNTGFVLSRIYCSVLLSIIVIKKSIIINLYSNPTTFLNPSNQYMNPTSLY